MRYSEKTTLCPETRQHTVVGIWKNKKLTKNDMLFLTVNVRLLLFWHMLVVVLLVQYKHECQWMHVLQTRTQKEIR